MVYTDSGMDHCFFVDLDFNCMGTNKTAPGNWNNWEKYTQHLSAAYNCHSDSDVYAV